MIILYFVIISRVQLSDRSVQAHEKPIQLLRHGCQVHVSMVSTFSRDQLMVKPTEIFLRKIFGKMGTLLDVQVNFYAVAQVFCK